MVSAIGLDDGREGGTGGRRGAGGGTVALREGGRRRQGEFGGGGGDDVWCEGVRDGDTGTGEERAKATRGPESGDDDDADGVQFCRVVQGRGESSDSQACEVVLPREEAGAREDTKKSAAAHDVASGECLVLEGSGQSPGEGRQNKSSSRAFEDGADANEQPRAMFGRGGASGVFGEVDPGVLAELPPEIQREIWMQQVRRLTTGRVCLLVAVGWF